MTKYRFSDSDFYDYPIHPKALELADFPFFWDVCDENAPFGSDEGYEAFNYYWHWDEKYKSLPIEKCLYDFLIAIKTEKGANELINLCFIPYDVYLTACKNYLESEIIFQIWELDQYIIAIGLGGFVKYGVVHSSIKKHLFFSLERMYKTNPHSSQSFNDIENVYEKMLRIVGIK